MIISDLRHTECSYTWEHDIYDMMKRNDNATFMVPQAECCKKIILNKQKWIIACFQINPFMPGGNKKLTHTKTFLQLQVCLSMCNLLSPPGIKGLIDFPIFAINHGSLLYSRMVKESSLQHFPIDLSCCEDLS